MYKYLIAIIYFYTSHDISRILVYYSCFICIYHLSYCVTAVVTLPFLLHLLLLTLLPCCYPSSYNNRNWVCWRILPLAIRSCCPQLPTRWSTSCQRTWASPTNASGSAGWRESSARLSPLSRMWGVGVARQLLPVLLLLLLLVVNITTSRLCLLLLLLIKNIDINR